MSILATMKRFVPVAIKNSLRHKPNKYEAELAFWKEQYTRDDGKFHNGHYQDIMLGLANQLNQNFIKDKTIADFGCGPRGSLVWATSAKRRIGIDVLAREYQRLFNTADHDMEYLQCSETVIPLRDGLIDVLFTMNALDHVSVLDSMCSELLRILVPGGLLVGAFNLNEPPTDCEPQTLTEEMIIESLFNGFDIISKRIGPRDPDYTYRYVLAGAAGLPKGSGADILAIVGRKPALRG